MPEYKVEVFCKNEKLDVATIVTPGPLDVATIRKGAQAIDGRRFNPFVPTFVESEHTRCAKCQGYLWLRLADGRTLELIPGMFKVEG